MSMRTDVDFFDGICPVNVPCAEWARQYTPQSQKSESSQDSSELGDMLKHYMSKHQQLCACPGPSSGHQSPSSSPSPSRSSRPCSSRTSSEESSGHSKPCRASLLHRGVVAARGLRRRINSAKSCEPRKQRIRSVSDLLWENDERLILRWMDG
eukprot:gnl/TRDRNA2_/TRDRNA2_175578_c0_seq1.p1 gnl/TRDRNA2_/TRDRNA2_175578_c0~~gnl/TRDRNA2_/TRDRNA2_175578_c0_seq1.p1  ORF type:complete len:153 (+),score=13.04 gnl/TRDRNA2_/TRDRNA2_175578_c0_seq1:97-555(+)